MMYRKLQNRKGVFMSFGCGWVLGFGGFNGGLDLLKSLIRIA
jgi:hypothetical protein